ncbi:response regulator transcription factor [Pseudokineococcus marinus]|uniref:Response regulator transcription factor n=1 Tax=Pseudokineococcus marinus TaxID=351215 RepID=A0A849BM06_9ACTN|nr:response regulator transcription factor [Pseudokineococcus marinus]NNH24230.1 response regulator transcription factor [Pseudokineococcus marinus]
MPRSALVVEDDPGLRRVISLVLGSEGFDVVPAGTGGEALAVLAERDVDVVLLDLRLPDVDGLEVLREVRRSSLVPVVVVSARDDSHDVVAGLEAGADDYVTKPFVAKELTARVRALVRRATAVPTSREVPLGDVVVRPGSGDVLVRGEPVALTRTEQRLLVELAAEPGRVLSREELLERVWGRTWFGDVRVVDVHVHRLRAKVEHDPSRPRVVLTVRGQGYRLSVDAPAPRG